MGDAVGNSILFIIIPLYVAKLPAPSFPIPESVRVGLLIALYGLVNSALQPFMGAASDRMGRKKILIQAGLFLMALSTLGYVVANRFADLPVLRSVQGVGVALSIPASMALMTAATRKETRGGAMGAYSTFRMVGFAAGPLLGGFLYDHYGFNPAFYAGCGFIMLGVFRYVPETVGS